MKGPSGEGDGARTPEEKQEGLERDFDKSLTDFDEMLQGKQKEQADRREESGEGPRGAGGREGGGASYGGDPSPTSGMEEGEPGGVDDGGEGKPSSTTGDSGTKAATGAVGGGKGTGGGAPVPADIPDGQDDDIVARQLREAAEKEKNPELREKLWQEYRDYKNGTTRQKDKDDGSAKEKEEDKDSDA